MNAIELEGLTKRYKKGVVAVEDTSFTCTRNRVWASRTDRRWEIKHHQHAAQFHSASAERSRYLIARSPHSFTSATEVGYLPERPGFYGNFSAENNLRSLPYLDVREEREERSRSCLS